MIRLLLLFLLVSTATAADLTIGSPAPSIDVDHWVNGSKPVKDFERGRVYVVEFWATWCGPCVSSMPHMRDLQLRHREDVTITSITNESPEELDGFFATEVGDTTYGELASVYRLASDPDNSVSKSYMRGADQHGIPCAFIVGKSGEIEWIGHPMKMDEPLEMVVSDKWDRTEHAREIGGEQQTREKLKDIKILAWSVRNDHEKHEQVLKMLDDLAEESPAKMRTMVKGMKKQIASVFEKTQVRIP